MRLFDYENLIIETQNGKTYVRFIISNPVAAVSLPALSQQQERELVTFLDAVYRTGFSYGKDEKLKEIKRVLEV